MVFKAPVFIALLFFSFSLFSQNPDTENNYFPQIVGVKGFNGFIIAHRRALRDVSQSNPWGLQVEWSRHHITQKAWDYCGCYPRIGFSFTYTNFNNPEVLGNSYAAVAFIEPFLGFKSRIKPSFKMGLGLTYLDQLYDEQTNTENLFFSYPISFLVYANLGLHYDLNEKWNIVLEASYPHISNGGVKQPNKGINFPVAQIGAEYKLQPVTFVERSRLRSVSELHPDRWFVLSQAFYSRKDVVDGKGKFSVVGLSGSLHRIVSRMSAIHIGFEGIRDGSARERRTVYSDPVHKTYTISPFLGHDFLLGKFIFSQQLGYYFIKPSPSTNDLYQRISLQYLFTDWLQGGVSLKTHLEVAEFVDFRIGIRW